MNINIKNMVCNRCIMVVSQVLNDAGISIDSIQLGKVKISEELSPDKLETINIQLKKVGSLKILENKNINS